MTKNEKEKPPFYYYAKRLKNKRIKIVIESSSRDEKYLVRVAYDGTYSVSCVAIEIIFSRIGHEK